MPYYGSIEITDATGWSKKIPVEKARLMVGSAEFNDLVLPEEHGGGVYPAHMQFFFSAGNPSKLRLVSLADTAMITHRHMSENDIVIPPKGTYQFRSGDTLIVGDFLLKFHLHTKSGITREARSEHMIMVLELPRLELRTEDSLVGQLQVVNQGDLANCQFEFDLEGLDDSCYSIDPAPLLFPGSCEFLKIRFFHRGHTPAAGPRPFTIRAYAPTSYPTEEVTISETLFVAPVYQYEVEIEDGSQKEPAPIEIPAPAPKVVPVLPPPAPKQTSESPAADTPVVPAPAPKEQVSVKQAAPEAPPVAPSPPAPETAQQPPIITQPEQAPATTQPPAPTSERPVTEPAASFAKDSTRVSSEVAREIKPSPAPPQPQVEPDTVVEPDHPTKDLTPETEETKKRQDFPPETVETYPLQEEEMPEPLKTGQTSQAPVGESRSAPKPPPKIETPPIPENVIIEPPEKDLWASEAQNVPRTTSATPVRRLGRINRSSLLADQNIEIIKAQDAELLDQEAESDQEDEQ